MNEALPDDALNAPTAVDLASTDARAAAIRDSLEGQHVCPFCGGLSDGVHAICGKCTMENSAAARKATKQRIGPWYVLQSRNPAAPGMKFETLLSFVRKGRIKPTSIVRGPTTHQLWRFAAHVKGLSREFGVCHSCGGAIETDANLCGHCNRLQEPPLNPDTLLETSDAEPRRAIYKEIQPSDSPAARGEGASEGSAADLREKAADLTRSNELTPAEAPPAPRDEAADAGARAELREQAEAIARRQAEHDQAVARDQETIEREKQAAAAERRAMDQERERLARERAENEAERHALKTERDSAARQRAAADAPQAIAVQSPVELPVELPAQSPIQSPVRSPVELPAQSPASPSAENEPLAPERDALVREREALLREREALAREKEAWRQHVSTQKSAARPPADKTDAPSPASRSPGAPASAPSAASRSPAARAGAPSAAPRSPGAPGTSAAVATSTGSTAVWEIGEPDPRAAAVDAPGRGKPRDGFLSAKELAAAFRLNVAPGTLVEPPAASPRSVQEDLVASLRRKQRRTSRSGGWGVIVVVLILGLVATLVAVRPDLRQQIINFFASATQPPGKGSASRDVEPAAPHAPALVPATLPAPLTAGAPATSKMNPPAPAAAAVDTRSSPSTTLPSTPADATPPSPLIPSPSTNAPASAAPASPSSNGAASAPSPAATPLAATSQGAPSPSPTSPGTSPSASSPASAPDAAIPAGPMTDEQAAVVAQDLYRRGQDAEFHTDFRQAVALYQQILSLPRSAWPRDVQLRIKQAQELDQLQNHPSAAH